MTAKEMIGYLEDGYSAYNLNFWGVSGIHVTAIIEKLISLGERNCFHKKRETLWIRWRDPENVYRNRSILEEALKVNTFLNNN